MREMRSEYLEWKKMCLGVMWKRQQETGSGRGWGLEQEFWLEQAEQAWTAWDDLRGLVPDKAQPLVPLCA